MIDHDVDLLKQHQFKLRSLQIHDDRHGLLFDLWRQCALLEDLDLSTLRLPPWIAATAMDEFASLFDQRDDHGHPVRRVKSLTLPALITIQDETLVRVLRGCVPNRLTCLEMGESVIGRHTLRILLETQATSLERLTMEGRVVKGMDPGPWIQRLLCACPRLRELRMRSASSDITQVVRLHAHDIVGSSWVCSRLSSLHIPIIGIPTNLHTGADDNAVQMVNQVMRQIGKMKQLESLGTGFINDTSNTILRDTLPYSLGAGGLQHLASLKRLETLNVRRCAHRIRYAEARWMGEHWPRFREVNGLDRLWENDTSHPAQWLRSHGVYVPIS
ncbi:hypothetical protein DFQ26_004166 [Actinomortierella ambigua]|nr:hypothetical protein DFQ26_004166 [Actinomortierella ambigua]